MQHHVWIVLKIIDIIGQCTNITWTETEFQDRWKITDLMEKDPWGDVLKDGNETIMGICIQYLSRQRRTFTFVILNIIVAFNSIAL